MTHKSLNIHSTRFQHLALFLGILCLLPSCGEKQQLRKALREFQAATITFPDKLSILENGHIKDSITLQGGPRFVVYVSPEDCSSCRALHLADDSNLFDFAKKQSLDLYIVFSTNPEDITSVLNDLILASHLYPLWIDSQGEFSRNNSAVIPNDKRFHYFLLDPKGHPVVVGNPAHSDMIKSLIINFLNHEEKR